MVDQFPSPFLAEIPANLIPHEDCSHWSIAQVNQFFANWLGTQTKQTSSVYVPSFISSSAIAKEGASRPEKIAVKEPINRSTTWRKNQPVKHVKYGVGTVHEIEEKTSGEMHITVRFKIGLK